MKNVQIHDEAVAAQQLTADLLALTSRVKRVIGGLPIEVKQALLEHVRNVTSAASRLEIACEAPGPVEQGGDWLPQTDKDPRHPDYKGFWEARNW